MFQVASLLVAVISLFSGGGQTAPASTQAVQSATTAPAVQITHSESSSSTRHAIPRRAVKSHATSTVTSVSIPSPVAAPKTEPTEVSIPLSAPATNPAPVVQQQLVVPPQAPPVVVAPTPVIQESTQLSNTNTYTNVDGNTVHSPAYSNDGSVPSGATAQCGDGSYSFSQNHRGTCSHHGGVAIWF